MSLRRVVASTVVRRVTLFALAAVFAWLGFSGGARAQSFDNCNVPTVVDAACPDLETAHAAAALAVDTLHNTPDLGTWPKPTPVLYMGNCPGVVGGNCFYAQVRRNPGGNAAMRRRFSAGCPTGTEWFGGTVNKCEPPCTSRPATSKRVTGNPTIRNGSTKCDGTCRVALHSNGDGTFRHAPTGPKCERNTDTHCDSAQLGAQWTNNYALGICVPPALECAANEVKDPHSGECKPGCPAGLIVNPLGECEAEKDECPAGNIRAPSGECLPGEGQCAAGEVRRPDGTCGRDADGDGEPDELGEGEQPSFSGGDSCDAPPACNGDAILCGQARIQWRIECNTRKDTKVSGGTCSSVPLCIGRNCDALEYSQLLQQWRTACTLEEIANGLGGGSGGGQSGQPDWTKVSGDGTEGAGEEPESPIRRPSIGIDLLDQGGLGFSGSCPSFGSVDLGTFGSYNLDSTPFFCEFVTLVAAAIMLLATGLALMILIKG